MTKYDQEKEKWECNLEWEMEKTDTEFDFSPIGRNPFYVSFDAITGELNESMKDIW